jgi:hypothetical protein
MIMGSTMLNINEIQEEQIKFLKEHFKLKTRTKVLYKCLEISYNTFKSLPEQQTKSE